MNKTELKRAEKLNVAADVLRRLEVIAGTIRVPYQHWLGGDDADQGPSYCRECAQKRVDNGEAEFVDGGWNQESDGCCHCEDCGQLLEYTLTDFGVREELDHFRGDRMRRAVCPEAAYHLVRLLEGYEAHPEVLAVVPKVTRALNRSGHALVS